MEKAKKSKENKNGEGSNKKGKPDPSDVPLKSLIFKNYVREAQEKTRSYHIKNPNLMDSKFYLFQMINNKMTARDMIFNLTSFYDENYLGNKDFIHIPTIKNIISNVQKYPVLLATKKDKYGKEEIMGTTTIKCERHEVKNINPYFPVADETILTITGILTKINCEDNEGKKIKGIGKELFKSSIKAAYNINTMEKVRLICEVDCRNTNSYNAVSNAVRELKQEGLNINLNIVGFYEVINNIGEMLEAPTFILEIMLNKNDEASHIFKEFNYTDCKTTELFSNLSDVIESNTKEVKELVNKIDNKTVIYHKLEALDALNVTFDIGNTANGNERIPSNVSVLQYQTSNEKLM